MILGMNNFSFNGQHFLQTHGTAMGTRMAPSYANLFIGKFWTACHRKHPSKTICLVEIYRWHFHDLDWRRRNLKTFINYINSIHPTIKFTHEYSNSSNQSLPFLDVQVRLTTTKFRPIFNLNLYLLKSSCHPAHTKRTIPFSLSLRLHRICSTDHFFNNTAMNW